MIERKLLTAQVQAALNRSRIVALIGPRQSGKTTLALTFVVRDSTNYFDLEDDTSLSRLDQLENALRDLTATIVIDEIQRTPEIFPTLHVLADRQPLPTKILILGSGSPAIFQSASKSLAGRIETIPFSVSGLNIAETGEIALKWHWLRGGFPLSFFAKDKIESTSWRKNFIRTFLERDLLQLGIRILAVTMLRFWTMLAHYHGQSWNGAEIARVISISEMPVQRYLDILEGVSMLRV